MAQAVLPNKCRRDPCITGFGQVAIRRAANETAVARRLEPAARLAVRDDWLRRSLRLLEFATPAATMPAVAPSVAVIKVAAAAAAATSSALATRIILTLRCTALHSTAVAFARRAFTFLA
jgi:hypothetical protein